MSSPTIRIGLNAVIVAVTEEEPRILVVPGPDHDLPGPARDALPYGPLDPRADRTLERSLRRWVREQSGLELGYVEQLYTFGDRDRSRRGRSGEIRLISVAYLALVREQAVQDAHAARWRPWYEFFPWEDRRSPGGRPVTGTLAPLLSQWVDATADRHLRATRRDRVDIAFGLGGAGWDEERSLERYELLYEGGLVKEAASAPRRSASVDPEQSLSGRPMAMDHRRMLATALGRIRGKLKYRPVVFELLPDRFTLSRLQGVVEALAGVRLHKQNFRRLVERQGLVEGTGEVDIRTGGRPAELFRFRKEALVERRAPGVGLPGTGP